MLLLNFFFNWDFNMIAYLKLLVMKMLLLNVFFFYYYYFLVKHILHFNSVLFAQKIRKELILLCMDYDVRLGKKMLKIKSNKYYHRKTLRRYIKIHGPWPLDLNPHTFLH